jgi:Ino eighty subunit 2
MKPRLRSDARRRRANESTFPRKSWRMKRCAYGHPVSFPPPPTHDAHNFLYKAETINRLLKKKSGTRNRRNPLASAEDRTPATHTGNGTPAEGEMDEDESGEAMIAGTGAAVQAIEVIPTQYRWISTSRPSPDAPPGDKMFLSFSVPASLLPTTHQSAAPDVDADGDVRMETTQEQEPPEKLRAMAPAVCDVEGCSARRKYRLVRDWEGGACGMDHLHVLERKSGPIAV